MDLLQNRKGWSVIGAAVGFGLLVAWMVPPTQPRQVAPNWRTQVTATAPPAPVDFIGFSPAMAAMPAYPVERYAYAGDDTGEGVAIHRGRSDEVQAPAVVEPPSDRDDFAETTTGAPQPDYREGYRWAERGNVANRHICGAAPNRAVENGCLAYFDGRRSDVASERQGEPADDDEPDDQ